MRQARGPLVWVVEDDGGLRGSILRCLTSAGIEAVGYESAESFLRAFDPRRPGCVVLDLRLPGEDGLALQSRLCGGEDAATVLFISGHGDVSSAVRAFRGGATDFLQKPFGEETLLAAVELSLERDAQLRRRREQRGVFDQRADRLTPRERELLDLLLADGSTKAIATRLSISPRTVELHRQRVLRKMEVGSVSGLMRLYFGHTEATEPPTEQPAAGLGAGRDL